MDAETGELKSILKELLTHCQTWRVTPVNHPTADCLLSAHIREAQERYNELYPPELYLLEEI